MSWIWKSFPISDFFVDPPDVWVEPTSSDVSVSTKQVDPPVASATTAATPPVQSPLPKTKQNTFVAKVHESANELRCSSFKRTRARAPKQCFVDNLRVRRFKTNQELDATTPPLAFSERAQCIRFRHTAKREKDLCYPTPKHIGANGEMTSEQYHALCQQYARSSNEQMTCKNQLQQTVTDEELNVLLTAATTELAHIRSQLHLLESQREAIQNYLNTFEKT
jgi:hypothetical protein